MAKTDDTSTSPTLEKAQAHLRCAQGGCNTASVGAYAQPSFDLSPEAWEKEKDENKTRGKQWKESVQGRSAIRLFSRGVMGAIGFALGSSMARSYGRGYNPNLGGQRYTWDRIAEEAAKESVWHKTAGKFVVHGIARVYDDLFGTAIKALGNAVGKDGREWVTFRPTRTYKNYDSITGRSLGQEVVGVTLDFATMSFADAMGRDIADWFDPNVKHDIYDKKGNVDAGKTLNASAKALWRYVTYNSGEDWAVAVPYVYFMKGQRHLLNDLDPGFAYDSDRALNGASFKLNDKGRIVGNYGKTGAIDLQTRFTVYNIGTLMFREIYSELGNRFQWYQHSKNPADLLHTHREGGSQTEFMKDPLKVSYESVGRVANWAARSVIKATLYMTPAVPFFWMTRTPQMKYRGVFIHPEKGMVVYKNNIKPGMVECLHANEPRRTEYHSRPMPKDSEFFYTNLNAYHTEFDAHKHVNPINFNPLEDPAHNMPRSDGSYDIKEFDAYSKSYDMFDTVTQPFGRISNTARKQAHHGVRALSEMVDQHSSRSNPAWVRGKWKTFSDQMVNASFAYTPYFMMKSDIAGYYWDTGKMDFSIDGLLEGVRTLNYKKTSRGFGEIWDTMWGNPLKDPAREVSAQKERCADISLSDGVSFRTSRTECLEDALKEICDNKHYQNNPETRYYVEQLRAQREHGHVVDISEPKKNNPDKPESFTERHKHRGAFVEPPKRDEGFVAKEIERHSKDPFPQPGVTLH